MVTNIKYLILLLFSIFTISCDPQKQELNRKQSIENTIYDLGIESKNIHCTIIYGHLTLSFCSAKTDEGIFSFACGNVDGGGVNVQDCTIIGYVPFNDVNKFKNTDKCEVKE